MTHGGSDGIKECPIKRERKNSGKVFAGTDKCTIFAINAMGEMDIECS